jgi:hypothetical protein
MGKYKNIAITSKMESAIDKTAKGLAGVGVIGEAFAPGLDIAVIVPAWTILTIALAVQAGQVMEEQKARRIAMAVCTGVGALVAGTKVASTVIGWLAAPFTFGLSLLVSVSANATLNYTFTKAYGRSAARYFLASGDITDSEIAFKAIVALIGLDLGIPTPYDHLIS